MASSTLREFADQIGVTSNKLQQQLAAAGIPDKEIDGTLSDQEKEQLLSYLRGSHEGGSINDRPRITLNRKSSDYFD